MISVLPEGTRALRASYKRQALVRLGSALAAVASAAGHQRSYVYLTVVARNDLQLADDIVPKQQDD